MTKVNFSDSRAHIEECMSDYNMTLAESVVNFLDSHEIPIDKAKRYIDPSLYDRLLAELTPLRSNYNEKDEVNIFSFIKPNKENNTKKTIRRIKR